MTVTRNNHANLTMTIGATDMTAEPIWWCKLCNAPSQDGLGDKHGGCEVCGGELTMQQLPDFPPQEPDGIAKHWAETEDV